VVASTLLYLHQRFNYEQRKNLLKAVFERIYVQNRAIADVKLNPPFSFLLKNDIEKVFKNHPSGRTKEDVFEQIINFTLSEQYMGVKGLVNPLVEKAKSLQDIANLRKEELNGTISTLGQRDIN